MGEIPERILTNQKLQMATFPVPVLDGAHLDEILNQMKKRKPLLIKNWDLGPCVDKWNFDYVSSKVGTDPVRIHVSSCGKLNFINKNFCYKTLPFNELINRVSRNNQTEFFIQSDELYYLRSIGNDPRGKNVSNFAEQCPQLSEDLKIPPFFHEKDFFSSVFRVSSQGLQLWTHYDVMDNILIQVKGAKRVVLWPPSEADKMYLVGDKSEVLDVDNPDPAKYPKFMTAVRYECAMTSGDVIYIPAMWFHNTLAIEPSLGVNFFWKNLPHEFYDKSDPYGNKDLLPGAKSLRGVDGAIKALSVLPVELRKFYILRMINVLQEELKKDSLNETFSEGV